MVMVAQSVREVKVLQDMLENHKRGARNGQATFRCPHSAKGLNFQKAAQVERIWKGRVETRPHKINRDIHRCKQQPVFLLVKSLRTVSHAPNRETSKKSSLHPNGHHELGLSSSENEDPNLRQLARDSLINNDLSQSSGLSDDSRDAANSMRAGSMAIPVADNQSDAAMGGPSALGSFTFATSDEKNPVRRYDPEQHYPAVHNSARASAPASDLELQQRAGSAAQAVQPLTGHSGSNDTSSNLRGGDDTTLTPTPQYGSNKLHV